MRLKFIKVHQNGNVRYIRKDLVVSVYMRGKHTYINTMDGDMTKVDEHIDLVREMIDETEAENK